VPLTLVQITGHLKFYLTVKARHRDTHKLRIHQIGVRVDGWKSVGPVSVDKVGVYFRQALPELHRAVSTSC
jgi:vacuolar protein sorting-associated protein 13D